MAVKRTITNQDLIDGGATPTGIGLPNVTNIKNNLVAVIDPTVNDDIDLGYTVGSRWINTATLKEFVCLDNTDGAAVWKQTSTRLFKDIKPVSQRTDLGKGVVRQIAESGTGNFTIGIPSDVKNVVAMNLIAASQSAGGSGAGKSVTFDSDYGNVEAGEVANNHSESSTNNSLTFGSGVLRLFKIDVKSEVFSVVSAGDIASVKVTHNAVGGMIDYIAWELIFERVM